MNRPVVLTLAGLDPTGGAGIAADIRAITRAGAHCCPVITALTVQDTTDAMEVRATDAGILALQLDTLLQDVRPAAVKTGLLVREETVARVAGICRRLDGVPLVIDPVLCAGGGTRLVDASVESALRDQLLPLATLATPNRSELEALCPGDADPGRLLTGGCDWLLVTDADAGTDPVQHELYGPDGYHQVFACPRLDGAFHGSGCTLAATIAAHLASGVRVPDAVATALEAVHTSLEQAFPIGHGQWIPG